MVKIIWVVYRIYTSFPHPQRSICRRHVYSINKTIMCMLGIIINSSLLVVFNTFITLIATVISVIKNNVWNVLIFNSFLKQWELAIWSLAVSTSEQNAYRREIYSQCTFKLFSDIIHFLPPKSYCSYLHSVFNVQMFKVTWTFQI